MKKAVLLFAVCLLATSMAFAQSSGNFDGAVFSGTCTIGAGGAFGGNGACQNGTNASDCEVLNTTIKTSSGSGVTLLITPSAVTGLFTNTKITTTIPSASAEIGIKVCVNVDGSAAHVVGGDINGCAMYDERFQQISTNLFSTITECATATTECNFDLILSTLSAHSYNFLAQVPNGQHTVTAAWSVVDAAATANSGSSVAACLGPGNVTVTQTKVFSNSGSTLTF